MSLVVTVYVPSGIVMAADSRMTVLRSEDRVEGEQKTRVQQQLVLSDNAYKGGGRRGGGEREQGGAGAVRHPAQRRHPGGEPAHRPEPPAAFRGHAPPGRR